MAARISVMSLAWAFLLVGAAGLEACGDASEAAIPPPRASGRNEAHPWLPSVELQRAFGRLTFRRPVLVTNCGDDRLFVLEQGGRIRVFENRPDVEVAGVFLDITPKVRMRHNEEGLLALAFDPDYASNGHFYVYYSASDPRRGVLSRFTRDPADPDRADPASELVILEVEQPYGNHNGATAAFGPDGYLYLSLGDGGLANDPHANGQNLATLLASILRLDVKGATAEAPYAVPQDNPFVGRPGARPEIWAYGLRNVWRMSFDRVTGDLWAGDVGQNAWEEIDLITKGGNYGWNIREANAPFRSGEPPDPLIDPIVAYPQRRGREVIGQSVTGGNVYRGRAQKGLPGIYLYADYVTGRIWGLRYEDGKVTAHREVFTPPPRVYITSFGEDAQGELYVCAFDNLNGSRGGDGRIYRVVEREGT